MQIDTGFIQATPLKSDSVKRVGDKRAPCFEIHTRTRLQASTLTYSSNLLGPKTVSSGLTLSLRTVSLSVREKSYSNFVFYYIYFFVKVITWRLK